MLLSADLLLSLMRESDRSLPQRERELLKLTRHTDNRNSSAGAGQTSGLSDSPLKLFLSSVTRLMCLSTIIHVFFPWAFSLLFFVLGMKPDVVDVKRGGAQIVQCASLRRVKQ
ncbi:hypothetical protein DNTS_034513 [Danionella cerebrum]|uniref:Uncharacterized protein n=1 Tax=Danionella cerebrum TaxID=2873325 RepID=A0A553MPI5_9TELE|nr:hypothetical protein DNTS_034513 [Danionella translucida]